MLNLIFKILVMLFSYYHSLMMSIKELFPKLEQFVLNNNPIKKNLLELLLNFKLLMMVLFKLNMMKMMPLCSLLTTYNKPFNLIFASGTKNNKEEGKIGGKENKMKYSEKDIEIFYKEMQESYKSYLKKGGKEVENGFLLQQKFSYKTMEDLFWHFELVSVMKIASDKYSKEGSMSVETISAHLAWEDMSESMKPQETYLEMVKQYPLENLMDQKELMVFSFFLGFFVFVEKMVSKESEKGSNLKNMKEMDWDKMSENMDLKFSDSEDNIWSVLYSEMTGMAGYKSKMNLDLDKDSLGFLSEKKKVGSVEGITYTYTYGATKWKDEE